MHLGISSAHLWGLKQPQICRHFLIWTKIVQKPLGSGNHPEIRVHRTPLTQTSLLDCQNHGPGHYFCTHFALPQAKWQPEKHLFGCCECPTRVIPVATDFSDPLDGGDQYSGPTFRLTYTGTVLGGSKGASKTPNWPHFHLLQPTYSNTHIFWSPTQNSDSPWSIDTEKCLQLQIICTWALVLRTYGA